MPPASAVSDVPRSGSARKRSRRWASPTSPKWPATAFHSSVVSMRSTQLISSADRRRLVAVGELNPGATGFEGDRLAGRVGIGGDGIHARLGPLAPDDLAVRDDEGVARPDHL